jgi:hypothetical protein
MHFRHLPFSNVHFHQYVQKASTYKVLYRVSGDATPDDAALAGKGAAVSKDKCSIPKVTNAISPLFI